MDRGWPLVLPAARLAPAATTGAGKRLVRVRVAPGSQPELRPSVRDVVKGDHLRGQQRGVAECDGRHHRAEPDGRGFAGKRAQERPRLEIRIVRHQQIVVDPNAGEAKLLCPSESLGQRGVGSATEAEDTEAHAHYPATTDERLYRSDLMNSVMSLICSSVRISPNGGIDGG
jgi:hypothetical protein